MPNFAISSVDNLICPRVVTTPLSLSEQHESPALVALSSDEPQECYWNDVIGCGGKATLMCPVHRWYSVCEQCQKVVAECYGCATSVVALPDSEVE